MVPQVPWEVPGDGSKRSGRTPGGGTLRGTLFLIQRDVRGEGVRADPWLCGCPPLALARPALGRNALSCVSAQLCVRREVLLRHSLTHSAAQ